MSSHVITAKALLATWGGGVERRPPLRAGLRAQSSSMAADRLARALRESEYGNVEQAGVGVIPRTDLAPV